MLLCFLGCDVFVLCVAFLSCVAFVFCIAFVLLVFALGFTAFVFFAVLTLVNFLPRVVLGFCVVLSLVGLFVGMALAVLLA